MVGKTITNNRIATHEYFILEKYEAGIVLEGGEVKSIKSGKVNLRDSFCVYNNGYLILKNMQVTVYDKASSFSSRNEKRDRILLMKKGEILKIKNKVEQKGLTLVPLSLYLKDALIKVELALCQGKHTYDKKQSIKEKDLKREKERILKNY